MGYMNNGLNVVFSLVVKISPQVMGCGMGKAAASLGKKRERGRVRSTCECHSSRTFMVLCVER